MTRPIRHPRLTPTARIVDLERRVAQLEDLVAKLEGRTLWIPGEPRPPDRVPMQPWDPHCPAYGTIGDPTPPNWIGDDPNTPRATCVSTTLGTTTSRCKVGDDPFPA